MGLRLGDEHPGCGAGGSRAHLFGFEECNLGPTPGGMVGDGAADDPTPDNRYVYRRVHFTKDSVPVRLEGRATELTGILSAR